MAKRSVAVYTVLLLVVVLAISEIATVSGKLCEKSSQTYSGGCKGKKCDKKCIKWEKALHGACHKREGKKACFCYFDCKKKPKDAKPAPPDAATTPPPPPPDAGGGGGGGDAGGGGGGGDAGGAPPADGGGSPPPARH